MGRKCGALVMRSTSSCHTKGCCSEPRCLKPQTGPTVTWTSAVRHSLRRAWPQHAYSLSSSPRRQRLNLPLAGPLEKPEPHGHLGSHEEAGSAHSRQGGALGHASGTGMPQTTLDDKCIPSLQTTTFRGSLFYRWLMLRAQARQGSGAPGRAQSPQRVPWHPAQAHRAEADPEDGDVGAGGLSRLPGDNTISTIWATNAQDSAPWC